MHIEASTNSLFDDEKWILKRHSSLEFKRAASHAASRLSQRCWRSIYQTSVIILRISLCRVFGSLVSHVSPKVCICFCTPQSRRPGDNRTERLTVARRIRLSRDVRSYYDVSSVLARRSHCRRLFIRF